MAEEIINRVNQSGLTQIDLEDLRIPGERVFICLLYTSDAADE